MRSLSSNADSVYLAGSRRLRQMKMPPLNISVSNTGFHMTKLTVFAAYSPDGSPAQWDFLGPFGR